MSTTEVVTMSETCIPHHDGVTTALTSLIIVGMTISYLPQHFRIIHAKSSEGFSPWFLLLGSTSSASGIMNIIVMQWGIIKCCRVLSVGNCIESTAGILQLGLQWFLFTIIFVLYMMYYPPKHKYEFVDVDLHDSRPPHHINTTAKTDDWKLSIILSWVVLIHFAFATFVTFFLLMTNPSPDPTSRSRQISTWATFLGVTSALLAALQYAPQIWHTYNLKLVGALSIKMMLIQSPGALFMVLSIALRPGTNWTTWLPYAVAGAMQGTLLIMCLFWQARQHRLEIDDFGRPLKSDDDELFQEDSSVTVTGRPDEGILVSKAHVGVVVDGDMREEPGIPAIIPEDVSDSEETPLLGKKGKGQDERSSWFGWLRR